MAIVILQSTTNFQVQYESDDYAKIPGEAQAIHNRAQALLVDAESDYITLCGWFGIQPGTGLGPNNRVIITLNKTIRGGINSQYSTNNPTITMNSFLGASADYCFAFFVAEMSEILMSQQGNGRSPNWWDAHNSGGEGLSRVCAELLHPSYQIDDANAWVASDAPNDPTSAQADDTYRKDWVTQNFLGGPNKKNPPGHIKGDDDAYSIGCAMLFIYYLKDQLGYSMPAIVQNGAATLDGTYRLLTNGRNDGFSAFVALIRKYFPNYKPCLTDDPFPLFDLDISVSHWHTDGCGMYYQLVGDTITIKASVNDFPTAIPRTKTTFLWVVPKNVQLVSTNDTDSLIISLNSEGLVNLTVHVMVETASKKVPKQASIQFMVLTLSEDAIYVGLCKLGHMRFIPQPIPIGDPAYLVRNPAAASRIHSLSDTELKELRSSLIENSREVEKLQGLVANVIKERSQKH